MDQFSGWIKAMCYCPQEFTIDLYLRQYWRDERLVHQLEGPLTLSSGINKQLWLPSTYFLRAKLAYFHDVTTDNYLLQIQPDGSIFYSVRYRKGHSYCNAFSWQSIWSGDGSFAIEPWKCLQSKKKADMSNSWSRGYITTVPELYLLIHIIDRAGSFARKSTYRLIDWLIDWSTNWLLNPFTPKSDQVQICLNSNITSHSMKNMAFHSLLRLKDDSCTSSHYLTYTFLFKRLGECTFWAWDWKC